MKIAKEKGVEIILPTDFVISSKFGEDGDIKTATTATGIEAGFMGLDCGPDSIKANAAAILRTRALTRGSRCWAGLSRCTASVRVSVAWRRLAEAIPKDCGSPDTMAAATSATWRSASAKDFSIKVDMVLP
jgi:hypothetical protein